MMKVLRYVLIVLLLTQMSSHARSQSYIAYDLTMTSAGNGYAGNQGYGGTVGMEFDVNAQSILVTSLGVFDSGQDGFHNTLTTYIYNRDTQALVASVSFSGTTDTTAGTLAGYHRFKSIGGLVLTSGHYLIAADGFSNADREGNVTNGNGFVHDTFNDGGGLITALPPSVYASGPGLYPTIPSTTTDSLGFNAGSFTFSSISLAVPEPSSVVLLTSLIGVGGLFTYRSSRRKSAKNRTTNV
jgi:hypothetical protein